MTDEETIVKVSRDISMIWGVDQREIAKIVHSYLERGISCEYDRLNSPPPPIPIRPVKIESLKEKIDNYKRRKKEMKATSTQSIKNVNNVTFTIENYPMERESKLTVIATTNDDIFEFEFEGPDLLKICKAAGLFTGWEKDQEIREKNREINKLNEQLHETIHDKKRLEYKLEEKDKTIKDLQSKYDLERGANEAHHRFFRQYAGDGVEVSYVIVDKGKYESLKNCDCKIRLHGMDFTRDELVDRIKELEALKTPTIENFTDEEPSSRRDILRCAEKCVCGKREQDYGTPESNFQLIADLWNDYLKKERSSIVVDAKDVAMLMALMKIARIRNGGGSGDSFVDLAGYAACGGEIWASNKEINGDSN